MSAFVVGKPHIDIMVRLAMASGNAWLASTVPVEWREISLDNADATGQMLVDACARSVAWRYSGDTDSDLPGPHDRYWTRPYWYPDSDSVLPTPLEGIKLVQCYEYQSCEHPDWDTSEAKRFCDALTRRLIDKLPGYGAAKWEWTTPSKPMAGIPLSSL